MRPLLSFSLLLLVDLRYIVERCTVLSLRLTHSKAWWLRIHRIVQTPSNWNSLRSCSPTDNDDPYKQHTFCKLDNETRKEAEVCCKCSTFSLSSDQLQYSFWCGLTDSTYCVSHSEPFSGSKRLRLSDQLRQYLEECPSNLVCWTHLVWSCHHRFQIVFQRLCFNLSCQSSCDLNLSFGWSKCEQGLLMI